MTRSNQKPKRKSVACSACGGVQFERESSEQGALVKLYANSFGYTDTVIREGDTEFTYACANCGKELTG